ncbi:MAG: sulfatase [Candidatus Brocadiia bacterium]
MNVVLIIADTLRYDHVGACGNQWIETPSMDRLAAQSTVFEHCYAASYPTLPHRTDVLTGRYGGPFHPWRPLRYDVATFPELVGRAGYCTQLMHDTPHMANGGHNFDFPFQGWTFIRGGEADRPLAGPVHEVPENWGRDPVFDFVDDELLKDGVIQNYARANRHRSAIEDWTTARLFGSACDWLEEFGTKTPFLLWVDSFDPHEPWDAPREFVLKYAEVDGFDGKFDPRSQVGRNEEGLTKEAAARIRAFYAAEVSWMDHNLGRLLDALEETGLHEETAVIFTSDHGTNLGERNRFGKFWPPREKEAHVPLFIRVPGATPRTVGGLVQPQDITATVLSLCGVEETSKLEGRNLLETDHRQGEGKREIVLTGCAADAGWAQCTDEPLLFATTGEWNLHFAADPRHSKLNRVGSSEDVSEEHPRVRANLRESVLNSLRERNTDSRLLRWLEEEGRPPFPDECEFWEGWPSPPNYTNYFGSDRLYASAMPDYGGK